MSSIKLEDGYWLYDYVIRNPLAINWLLAGNLGEVLNRPHHRLEYTQLVDTLLRLFREGDFTGFYSSEGRPTPFAATEDEIIRALNKDPEAKRQAGDLYYGLTAQGGKHWEETTNPQWQWFMSNSEINWRNNVWEYISMSSDLLKHYLELETTGYIGPDTLIVANSVQEWDELVPWAATYWKTLPIGHRVRITYEFEEKHISPEQPESVRTWLRKIQYWYTPPTNSSAETQ